MTYKIKACHGVFFFLPILLYIFIFMTINSLKKEKEIIKVYIETFQIRII